MRFSDFRIVESRKIIKEDEDFAAPSNTMSGANLYPRGETKYITAISKSIRAGKPFAFIPIGKAKASKEATFGVIDKIFVDGKEMSVDDWEIFAGNTDNKDAAGKTEFEVDGDIYSVSKMWKTEAVMGGMSINKGDAAEAILGAAITAKFRNGGRDVKPSDVVAILKTVVAQGDISGKTDYQTAGVEDDNFKFMLTLNVQSMKSLRLWIEEEDPLADPKKFAIVRKGVDPKTIKGLQKQISDATQYANSNKRAITAVEKAKADPKQNTVEVISDGGDATQQSATKVDLKIAYDGQTTRLLSLKAGTVKQFGQGTGGGWDQVSDFFESALKFRLPDSMKDKFGFKDKQSKEDKEYLDYNYSEGPFAKLYAEMAKQAMVYTKDDNVQQEYNLVKNVYDAINFHATRGEEGVTMVILSPSAKVAYKELAFDARLLSALELYDLQVVNQPGLSTHRISIVGNLKTEEAINTLGKDNTVNIPAKSVLVDLSSRKSGGTIRNLVEMGPLLKDLANIEKLDADEAAQKAQTSEPQVAAEPAPVDQTKQTNDPNAKI